jgi:hypothetical protein
MGSWRIIGVGGKGYIDMGTGTFTETDTAPDLGSLDPAEGFSGLEDTADPAKFDNLGSETVNGLPAVHYQAKEAWLAVECNQAGEGVVSCTAEVWLARDGGLPVKLSMVGKDASDQAIYEAAFDVTNVNDPSNTVEAPTL